MINKTSHNLLTVINLSKHYLKHKHPLSRHKTIVKSVNDVSFSIKPGSVMGLVGESGSGKTTLAMMLAGLIQPTSGEIFFDNKLIQRNNVRDIYKHDLRMIFQDPYSSLNPRKTIFDNLGHHLLYHKIAKNREEQSIMIHNILEKIGLSRGVLSQYPHQLSGGMLQRISIGRAVIGNAKFIICDEIVSALDLSLQAQILNMLKNLQKELQLSYLFISHDLAVVNHFCPEVLIMYKGEIVEWGATREIFSNPKSDYTKMLLGAQPATHPKHSMIRKAYSSSSS